MRKRIIAAAVLSICSMVFTVSAQEKVADHSGDWTLDMEKSELGERSRLESMTMNVAQTGDEITYERKATRSEGGGGQGRRGRGGGGNPGPITYKLDGTETSTEVDRGFVTGTVKRKAENKDGKLILNSTSILETPRGERTITAVETWELSDNGKTLTISTERETPRGTNSSKMVFTKS